MDYVIYSDISVRKNKRGSYAYVVENENKRIKNSGIFNFSVSFDDTFKLEVDALCMAIESITEIKTEDRLVIYSDVAHNLISVLPQKHSYTRWREVTLKRIQNLLEGKNYIIIQATDKNSQYKWCHLQCQCLLGCKKKEKRERNIYSIVLKYTPKPFDINTVENYWPYEHKE